ncbi:MAG: hypothetical protein R6V05_13155 [Candidatus Brocadiia bacterium]
MERNRIGTLAVIVAAALIGGFAAQAVLGTVVGGAHAASAEGVIRARAFVVVDEQGRELATLGARADATGLVVRDKEGNRRMVVGMLPDEQTAIVINGADQTTQLALGAWEKTNHLDLYDGAGRARFTVGVAREGGNAGLAFYDREKNERLAIGMGPHGAGDFVMKDASGMALWRASQDIGPR